MKRDWMLIAEILYEIAETGDCVIPPEQFEKKVYHLHLITEAGYLDSDGSLTLKGWDFHELSKFPAFQRAHDDLMRAGGVPTDLLIEVTKQYYHEGVQHRRMRQAQMMRNL